MSGKVQSEKQKPPYFDRGNFIPGICSMDDVKVENPNMDIEAA